MPLSWNEIRHNAIRFASEWAGETREEAEGKSFWDEFFNVFGIRRRLVATFEEPVKNIRGQYGFIDLFWPGVVLVEHKSAGKDLGRAESQAFRYIQDLARAGRVKEIPRYVIVSDFARVALHDLEPEEQTGLPLFEGRRVATIEFPLAELHRHIHDFAFIPGYKQHKFTEQDPINFEAVEMLGQLHDTLEAGGYSGHDLERFLVRILFCLFAEDTGLFERDAFRLYLENRTAPDGSDLGLHLARLFDVLDTPPDQRQKNLDETLAAFPYVNGELFAEKLGFADLNRDMRNALLACTRFDWSRISPAIFGSLFQAVMEPKERRQIGGHYTSERDILKVARSLFLDDFRAEFAKLTGRPLTPTLSTKSKKPHGASDPLAPIGGEGRGEGAATGMKRKRLEEFHQKLCALKFLDPACGCGNFLVITYRELRQLELEVLKELFGKQTEMTLAEINKLSQVDVDQFYGIEIGEWPARIAEVALWLMDHQMNLKVSEAFGQLYQRLPLKKSPHIHCANALRADWKQILPPAECSYVLGNPPFIGKAFQTAEQKADIDAVFGDVKGTGVLDYVCCWYLRAAQYIHGTQIKCAFVSTNSISQGEQAGILWTILFRNLNLKIHFAHRTFPWVSEARGKAHVHVVIVGFGAFDATGKRIYDYETEKVTVAPAKNISPYLVEGSDAVVQSRSKPICTVPEIIFGNMPNDGGNLILSSEEKSEILIKEPGANKFIRPFLGAQEFLNGKQRWCLWLKDVSPAEFRAMPEVMKRVEGVRKHRTESERETTRELANTPALFGEIRQPASDYLLIPSVSSENRNYIPIGFMPETVIGSNLVLFVPNATRFHFGVLSSAMHMAWTRQVCGRLKSDYRYSAGLVYNNFPWPENPTARQRAAVEEKAQAVLAVRAKFMGSAPAPGAVADALVGNPEGVCLSSAPKPSARARTATAGAAVLPTKTATLADLYDPLAMPHALVKAHAELDAAVDKCYRTEKFATERQRVEYLFALYEKLTAPLLPAAQPKRRRSTAAEPQKA
jgi:hypothetical protein